MNLKINHVTTIFDDFIGPDYIFPDTTVSGLFEEQAAQYPQNIALICEGQSLTYQEFNEKSNQLARLLRKAGVQGDSIVAIIMEPSLTMAIGIMGILKAGGAYLPIDPSYPEARIKYMLQDSEACLTITQSHLNHSVITNQTAIDLDRLDLHREAKGNLDSIINSQNIAYIIYTSGTTGRPKGVMVEHRSVVNTLCYRKNEYQLTPADTALEFFSFAFDGFVTIFFTPLISGAKVVLLSKSEIHDVEKIAQIIIQNQVTNIISVPALYGMLLESLGPEAMRSLKIVTLAGDTIPERLVRDSYHKSNSTEISVEYGVTEAAVMSTIYRHQEKDLVIKIGKPTGNTRILILDKALQPASPGTPGELCIGGAGLARGYLNKPGLTAEKFITNPYFPNEKLYLTGDLAQWHPDGNIIFLGRKDNQVKIRGFRIEISEIENRLLEYDGIVQAVVLARHHREGQEDPDGQEGPEGLKGPEGPKYLCAYYVSDLEIEREHLQHFLAKQLPVYMIPHFITKINEIPLTANGKIDRNALPDPWMVHQPSAERAPRTALEKTLIKIWGQVLGIKQLNLNDNFFHLGGDSIKAMQIANRLLNAGFKLKVKDLVNNPSPEGVIPYLKKTKSTHQNREESGLVPLTPIQKWFFENNFAERHHWNQAFLILSRRALAENHLETALNHLIKHHDGLRTVFSVEGATVIQAIKPGATVTFKLAVYDFSGKITAHDLMLEKINEIQKSFNLSSGLLIKAALFRMDDGDQLLIVAHHLIIDSVSFRIILEDLTNAYSMLENGQNIVLPDKTTSYQEWALKLTTIANDPFITSEIPYWEKIRQADPGLLTGARPAGTDTFRDSLTATVFFSKKETYQLLHIANKAYHTKINDLLITALAVALQKYTGKSDLLINLEGHGREDLFDEMDLTRTIGWFTASYPVLFNLAANIDLGRAITTVKETLRDIPKNGIGYGILSFLTAESGLKRIHPQPEINFNFLGEIDNHRQAGAFHPEEIELSSCISGNARRNFKWDLYGLIKHDQLFIHLNYNQYQFSQSTISSFGKILKELVLKVIDHCYSVEYTEFTKSDFNLDGFSDAQFELVKGKLHQELRRNNIQNLYCLSPMQEGILSHGLFNPNSDVYFQQMLISLSGAIEANQIETAFNRLVKKHEVLRTLFLWEEIPRPIQVVLKERPIRLYCEDITGTTVNEQPPIIQKIMQADRETKFDLVNEPLLRIKLIKTAGADFKLLVGFHHIIMDGWCFGLIFDDFLNFSAKLRTGARAHARRIEPGPVTPYSKYLKWLSGFNKEAARHYWEEYLADYHLPVYLGRNPNTTNPKQGINEKLIEIDRRLGAALINFAREHETTLNTVFQSAWGILLQKYRMRSDVIFGYVVSGRPPEIDGAEKMTGLFINTLPLRIKTDRNSTFIDILARVKIDSINSKPHESLSLAEIQSLSAVKRGLFDHLLIFENFPARQYLHDQKTKAQTGFEITNIEVFEKTEYGLTVTITPQHQSFTILFQYTDDFDRRWVELFGNHFLNIIQSLIANCHQRIEALSFAGDPEPDLILKTFRHPAKDFRWKMTVKELFEEAAATYSKNIAVRFRDQSITYHELNRRSNKLARWLIAAGACRDEIIGLLFYPSLEMMIGILAVLKSGAAYLPIEPDLPDSRIKYLISDSKVNLLIRGSETTLKSPASLTEIIIGREPPVALNDQNPDIQIVPDSLAYCVYTSGSTGNPKGVLVEHRQLLTYLNAFNDYFAPNSRDVFLQQASYSFDAFVEEMYPVLLTGGTIAVLPRDLAKDPVRFRDYAVRCRVTMISATPLLLNELDQMENIESVHTYISGGDVLKIEYLKNLLTRGKVYNTYGPTEATVCCTYYQCRREDELIPIGKPIAGYEILILADNKMVQPLLIPGEIHIGGGGVARGYLNRAELTGAKFIPHPSEPGELIYCSGDYGRVLPDGNIEFLGRIDTQVKIRGFRIETAEIESKLLGYDAINEAVVVSRTGKNHEAELCAYFTSAKEVFVNQLRDYLTALLPEHMIPAYLIRLPKIPVTASGKVNPAELPEPYLLINTGAEYLEPAGPDEKILVKVLKNVLNVDRVSVGDRFFNLGGDSLKAVRVVGGLKEYHINLELNLLMQNMTFKDLASHCTHPQNISKINHFQGEVKLHPYHIALFNNTFPHNFADAAHWNTSSIFLSAGRLDFNIVKMVATELVGYHDALRTVFYQEQGVIKQYVPGAAAASATVSYFDFTGVKERLLETLLKAMSAIQQSFKLDRLFKVALFRADAGDYLYFTGNHLITDAYSDQIIYEDFFNGYQQAINRREIEFFPKTDSYAKWIDKLYEYSQSRQLLTEIGHWKKVTASAAPAFPKDFNPDPLAQTLENVADLVTDLLDETNTAILKQYSFNKGRPIFDILLCAWSITVYRLTGAGRTRVFCVNNGRNHLDGSIDVSRTVGLLMITYPVLIDCTAGSSPETHLEYITDLLKNLPGRGLGFEVLKYLTAPDLKNGEQFCLPDHEKETLFNYVGEFTEDSTRSGFNTGNRIQPVDLIGDVNLNRSKKARWNSDFNLFISLSRNKLSVRFQYSISEYRKETVQKVITEFSKNIIGLIK